MPICLLVRHGETDWNRSGRVMGDQPIPINHAGDRQARELATFLGGTKLVQIFSSPVLRALQTAQILAERLQAGVVQAPGLREIDMGAWMNRFWRELADDPAKRDWYSRPDDARPAGGETLREVQRRAVAAVEDIMRTSSGRHFACVSHADVIRTILAHYLHMDLVSLRNMKIDHASATALEIAPHGNQLLFLNLRPTPDVLL
ncbi:MAG TPA: histidine phosphatase family protein [Nitrospiraceae bacterium]|nr:histidine phosphatase family protein [Nitrospiraceae bacterium]